MLVPLLGILLIRKEASFAAQGAAGGHRRERASPLLRLGRGAHGEPAGPLQPDQPARSSAGSRSSTRRSSRATGSPTRCPTASRRSRRASRLDAKLTGANPIDVLIEFPPGASLYAPETLATIADVHSIIEEQAGVGNVWSLETLRRWLAEKAGITDVAVLKQYVDILPEHLTRRFISGGRGCGRGQRAASPTSMRAQLLPVDQFARRRARTMCARRIPATRSRSPASRRSRRATAPA